MNKLLLFTRRIIVLLHINLQIAAINFRLWIETHPSWRAFIVLSNWFDYCNWMNGFDLSLIKDKFQCEFGWFISDYLRWLLIVDCWNEIKVAGKQVDDVSLIWLELIGCFLLVNYHFEFTPVPRDHVIKTNHWNRFIVDHEKWLINWLETAPLNELCDWRLVENEMFASTLFLCKWRQAMWWFGQRIREMPSLTRLSNLLTRLNYQFSYLCRRKVFTLIS